MVTPPAITDDPIAALVSGCQRGEAGAIETLYELYADRLYRYLLARTGDADVAADLTTEVFLRVIKAIGAFRLHADRPAATVSGWLYRIASNLAGEHYRANSRVLRLDQDHEMIVSTDPDPHTLAERKEELHELASAMDRLNEEQRLVIAGKFVENMSNAEIAAWLGKTEGAVKSLQHRAIRSLARFMRPATAPGQEWS